MTEAFEFPLDEVGSHVRELRRAAREGNVVYLTDGGRRLATVTPLAPNVVVHGARLAAVAGTLPGFERDVDVETSRDGWEPAVTTVVTGPFVEGTSRANVVGFLYSGN